MDLVFYMGKVPKEEAWILIITTPPSVEAKVAMQTHSELAKNPHVN